MEPDGYNPSLNDIIAKAKAGGKFDEQELGNLVKIVKKLMRRRKETVTFTIG